MSVSVQDIMLEVEFTTGVWTDIWADVTGDVSVKYGIPAYGPIDLIGTVGTLNFNLKNGTDNSGGLLGYYTPDHTNARSNWDLGKKIRLRIQYGGTWYYKFYGTVDTIIPSSGEYDSRQVVVRCVDFFQDMSIHKMDLVVVEQDYRSDQAIEAIIGNMTESPRATDYEAGQETFTYWGDDLRDERNTALQACRKVCLSEFGYLYIKGDQTGGGTLRFEDRHERVLNTTALSTIGNADIKRVMVDRNRQRIWNSVRAVTYPRDVGTSLETMLDMSSTPEIGIDATETIWGRLRDPNDNTVRVSAIDLLDPEGLNALTDQGSIDDRGFEGGVGRWTYAGSASGSVAQSSSYARKGTHSLELISDTSASANEWCQTPFLDGYAQGDEVAIQCYVRIPAAWPQAVKVAVNEYTAAEAYAGTQHTIGYPSNPNSGWQRITGNITITQASCEKLKLFVGNATAGDFSGGSVSLFVDEVYLIKHNDMLYEFSSAAVGGGDLNIDLELTDTDQGANTVQFVLHNTNSSQAGFVTKLQVRGKAIRIYEPITQIAEDDASIAAYYKRPLSLILSYQDNPLVGKDFADYVLSYYKDPQTELMRAEFEANRSNGTMTAALEREVGDRVNITENLTAISADYVINGCELYIYGKELIRMGWIVVIAGTVAYWLLGTADYGELGEVSWLGF